jgi:hypothetical protein
MKSKNKQKNLKTIRRSPVFALSSRSNFSQAETGVLVPFHGESHLIRSA